MLQALEIFYANFNHFTLNKWDFEATPCQNTPLGFATAVTIWYVNVINT